MEESTKMQSTSSTKSWTLSALMPDAATHIGVSRQPARILVIFSWSGGTPVSGPLVITTSMYREAASATSVRHSGGTGAHSF